MKPLTPQELSIGNLLNYDTGEGIELTVIDWQDSRWLQENPESFNNLHSPVPLTPEILDGFGFERESETLFSKNDIAIRNYSTKNDCYFSVEVNNGTFQIQHTHTLQNFIHAISGVELVYKQNKTE